MTRAPRSASRRVQYGPASTRVDGGEIRGHGERGEDQADRHVAVIVPAFLVQEVEGAEDVTVPADRKVQDRRATERGDERVVGEMLADVRGGTPEVGMPFADQAPAPRGVPQLLAAADGIRDRLVRVHALGLARDRV